MLGFKWNIDGYQWVIFSALSFDDSSDERGLIFLFTGQENKEMNAALPFLQIFSFITQILLVNYCCVHEMNFERLNVT